MRRPAFAAALPLLALATCGTAQAATHPLDAVRDAYVDSAAPATNFGAASDLKIATLGQQRVAYLTFDLAALQKKAARSAAITLTVRQATAGMSLSAFQVPDTSWDESTITWDNKPAFGTLLGTSGALVAGQPFIITLPRKSVPKSGLVSIALTTSSGNSAALRSRESNGGTPILSVVTAPVKGHGPLHTDGTVVRDSAGNEVHMTGFQMTGLLEGHGNAWPDVDHCGQAWRVPPTLDSDADRMTLDGFNTVRISISWNNLEPTAPTLDDSGNLVHHWDPAYLAAVDQEVTAFTDRGDYVVLSLGSSQWSAAFKHFSPGGRDHVCEGMGIPAWLYPGVPDGTLPASYKCDFFNDTSRFPSVPVLPQEGFAAAWQKLAGYFAGNTGVVGADLMTEPGWPNPSGAQACADTPTSDDLIAVFQKAVTAIRQVDAGLMAVFEDGTWVNYTTRGFTLTENPNIPNSIYSWHYYPNCPSCVGGQQALAEHLARAQEWNVPFNIGEFNAFNEGMNNPAAHTDEATWEQDTRDLMAYAKANHISWNMWQWRVGGAASMIDPDTGREKPLLLAVLQSGI